MAQAFLLIAVLLLSGCQSKHLVYVQEASLGLNIAASLEGNQKLSLGYDRDIYAIVPKKNTSSNDDAMSLFSINKVSIIGLDEMRVSEFVAAGEPACKLANKPDDINRMRKKVYGN